MSPRMMTSKLTPSGITAQILLFILSLPITCRPFRPHCLETFEGHDAVRIVLLLGVLHAPIHDNRMTYLLMLYIHAYTRAHAPVRTNRRSASEYAGSAGMDE